MNINIFRVSGWVIDLLIDSGKHFLLACSAGALVYSLTSTISFVSIKGWERGNRKQASSGVVFIILISCILLAVSLALASHYYLDYAAWWLTKPLDAPLELVIPGK